MENLKEQKALVTIAIVGFAVNLASIGGLFFGENGLPQLLAFRIGDTAALMGCITAGRYVGSRGLHVAASAFAMLAIVHGISASASGITSLNVEGAATMVIPMMPTFILLCWCPIFPVWVRAIGVLLVVPFGVVYYRVANGLEYHHWTLFTAYGPLVLLELMWALYLRRDLHRQNGEELTPATRTHL